MARPRKPRADSIAEQVKAAQAGVQPIVMPDGVLIRSEQDEIFLDMVLEALPRAEWSRRNLVLAASWARALADIQKIEEELVDEGWTQENARGTMVANPKVSVLETKQRMVLAFERHFGLAGRAAGKADDKAKGRAHQSQAQVDAQSADNDPLLNPTVQ